MKVNELKEIFLAEALEGYEELNKQLIVLEKDYKNKKAIETIFRITHTLKANAAGMGFDDVAAMAHTFEDVFSEIKNNTIALEATLFEDLFKANDIFGLLINAVKTETKVPIRYKGIKAKLEVLVRKSKYGENSLPQIIDNTSVSSLLAQNDSIENKIPKNDSIIATTEELQHPDNQYENKVSFSDLVSIPIRKLDNLLNLVGELMIERDRVVTTLTSQLKNRNEFSRLQKITSELQYSVMDVRLVQVNVLFSKFNRIVRDTAQLENKKVNLTLEGTENEIDRNILQIISDSLVHIVRNAISHGIETSENRTAFGKSEVGNVIIRAKSQKNTVIIEVEDDGRGINPKIIRQKALEKGVATKEILQLMTDDDVIQLIFEPGFSSAEIVTSVSGRGVGMDVVKKSIDSIGGKVNIKTNVGQGSTFSLILPSSMALKSALLFGLGDTDYAIPLSYTDAVIQLYKTDIHKVSKGLIASHLNKNISIVFLNDLFSAPSLEVISEGNIYHNNYNAMPMDGRFYTIVVSYGPRQVGFVVDKLMQQKEIVEKPLSQPLKNATFISGATILGNGKVCLVLDVPSIITHIFK